MRYISIFLATTHIVSTGLQGAMHGTGLVMIIARFRRCLLNFMMAYGNYAIELTLICTDSGVQVPLCLSHWGLVAQYPIISSAKWSTLVQVMACLLFDTKPLPEPMYSEQTSTIWYTMYQAFCKDRLRYMNQWWLIRKYNFHWHINQWTTFQWIKFISKWRLQNGRHIFQASIC